MISWAGWARELSMYVWVDLEQSDNNTGDSFRGMYVKTSVYRVLQLTRSRL